MKKNISRNKMIELCKEFCDKYIDENFYLLCENFIFDCLYPEQYFYDDD